MNAQETQSGQAVDVSIDILWEVGGFMSARVYRLDGTLIVMTPPCDTQDGAISIAKAMYFQGKLAISEDLKIAGTA